MRTFKFFHAILFVALILLIVLCIYGINTDCPNTEGYVFCGDSDTWSLNFWNHPKPESTPNSPSTPKN